MQLSIHFSLEELTLSNTAVRLGIDNIPSERILGNLKRLTDTLEIVRGVLGFPMHVSSGYRCAALNTHVGGSDFSWHKFGLAADFICPGFGNPYQTIQAIVDANIPYEELIHEFGRWVHIAIPPLGAPPSMDLKTTREVGPGYDKGLHARGNSGPLIAN